MKRSFPHELDDVPLKSNTAVFRYFIDGRNIILAALNTEVLDQVLIMADLS